MDGLAEWFNGTLKSVFWKFVNKTGKEYIPYLLFEYREDPQESTGFSPFELLYGWRVRKPLDVLRETWTGQKDDEDISTPLVVDVRRRLQEMMGIAQANSKKPQDKQRKIYYKNTHNHTLTAGNEILVLLPNPQHLLWLEWRGPYEVLWKVSAIEYETEMIGQRKEHVIPDYGDVRRKCMGSRGRSRKYRTRPLILGWPVTDELSEAKHRTAPEATEGTTTDLRIIPTSFWWCTRSGSSHWTRNPHWRQHPNATETLQNPLLTKGMGEERDR